jgi:hypothetical protein
MLWCGIPEADAVLPGSGLQTTDTVQFKRFRAGVQEIEEEIKALL